MTNPSSSFPPPPLAASASFVTEKAKEIFTTPDFRAIIGLVVKLSKGKDKTESLKLLYKCISGRFPSCLVLRLLQLYRFAIVSKIRSYALSLLDSLLMDLEDSRTVLAREALEYIKTHLNACLVQQEISDHDFKLLSRIVSRVAVSVFIRNMPWEELFRYILSLDQDHMKTLFIFRELPMGLNEEFVMPLVENNLEMKIEKGLSDPGCDEEWCLALGAGFNMALQLSNGRRTDLVWDMVYATVKSVWEMVNSRKRETVVRKGLMGIVRRVRREAFRFHDAEYEFVSRFALMMKGMNGVREETKIVANLIHEVLDHGRR